LDLAENDPENAQKKTNGAQPYETLDDLKDLKRVNKLRDERVV
jgi:hypothetical protein